MRQLLYTTCLLLIATLRFTCGGRKIWSTIKKSQNIMNMIVSKIFFFFYMSLLTGLIVKTIIFWLEFTISFLKKVLNSKFGPQWKYRKSSYKVRQMLALICNLVVLILSSNCAKGLRVTKIVKQIKFEAVWGKLEASNCFQRQSFTKYFR